MKPRLKTKAEKQYDSKMLDESKDELVKLASEFASEFTECDGDVFYSTYQKFTNANWKYTQAMDVIKMTKVGECWDYDQGITGEFKYRDMK